MNKWVGADTMNRSQSIDYEPFLGILKILAKTKLEINLSKQQENSSLPTDDTAQLHPILSSDCSTARRILAT